MTVADGFQVAALVAVVFGAFMFLAPFVGAQAAIGAMLLLAGPAFWITGRELDTYEDRKAARKAQLEAISAGRSSPLMPDTEG